MVEIINFFPNSEQNKKLHKTGVEEVLRLDNCGGAGTRGDNGDDIWWWWWWWWWWWLRVRNFIGVEGRMENGVDGDGDYIL